MWLSNKKLHIFKWISLILLIIINFNILFNLLNHQQLNLKFMKHLHHNVTVTTINSFMNVALKSKVYSTKPTEDKDLIVSLFEEIEISVLCEYFENEFGLEHMILLNITVSESTLYIRARLRIEQGGCTQQTIYAKWINYSVGLGVNKLRYRIDSLVYKQLHLTEQYKKVHQTIATGVNSVRFNVVRLLPEIVVNKSELKVCIMEQNCLHWIDRSRPCGLQEVRSIFKPKDYPLIDEWNKSGGWLAFQAYIQDLCSKNCSPHQCMNNKELQITHSAWFIPCSSCNKVKHQVNCDWSIALWYEPNNRLYPCLYNKQMIQNDQQLLTTYLKDRVLLFLGDSTLRGLMYSLLHRLNKTLFNVQETHKQITLINSSTKLTRFTYFPNYYSHYSNSIKTIHDNHHSFIHLLKSLLIFTQTFNEALLFVGGVRWLNSYHLNVIHNFIIKQKVFRSIKVFIKDYSAGFHTPIDGLPFINWMKRMKEYKRNEELIKLVKQYNWTIIPSHQITWTRLNHFHAYARCSCHFYHVVRQSIHLNITSSVYTLTDTTTNNNNKVFVYDIIGQIHWIMSRIIETTILRNMY